MADGREYEDLAPLLLGEIQGAGTVVKRGIPTEEQPPARPLARFAGNPVLRPIREHYWESRYLLNPGAIRLNGRVYIVYRAFGDDDISRLGLAASEDGFAFTERLEEPIFEPMTPSEVKGCEDPRLTLIDGRVYMLYTAYSGTVAQIAAASLNVDDFINYRWKNWHRHGLVFPGFTDKDAALFPEQLDGKYVMLHRVDPHIWITFSTHLRCPWPRKEHAILAGSRSGMVWDALKIGGGAQPIKTEYGWLLIYHGVDHNHVYRLGVMLVDLADPTILIYRSPNFILEPTERFEVGEKDESWVPNVVFTCGAVSRDGGKDILTARDEVLVYYGAADSVIGVATARIEDLVPEEFR
ncbi:MAG: glycosidase [Dehalococcoidales bacterium]|nr:glycosidase [Dehalococcoidales bacterium]